MPNSMFILTSLDKDTDADSQIRKICYNKTRTEL